MNTKWLDDLWYFLHKDYGTDIVYTRIGKADVNLDTGERQDVKTSLQIPAVFAPISLYAEYIQGKLGDTERASSRFLIRKSDLASIMPVDKDDYIVHQALRYNKLDFKDLFTLYSVGGVATPYALPYQVLQLDTFDNLGLGDGV